MFHFAQRGTTRDDLHMRYAGAIIRYNGLPAVVREMATEHEMILQLAHGTERIFIDDEGLDTSPVPLGWHPKMAVWFGRTGARYYKQGLARDNLTGFRVNRQKELQVFGVDRVNGTNPHSIMLMKTIRGVEGTPSVSRRASYKYYSRDFVSVGTTLFWNLKKVGTSKAGILTLNDDSLYLRELVEGLEYEIT